MASSIEPQLAAGEEENETFSFALQLLTGSVLGMALQTAFELGIFEIIGRAGPGAKLSASDIAARMPTKNRGAPLMVDQIARLLVSHNVLGCHVVGFQRHYSLSPVSYYFMRNQDEVSLDSFIALVQDKIILDGCFRRRNPIQEGAWSKFFEYTGLDARFNQVYNTAMFNFSTFVMKKIVESCKGFEGIKQLVDVGGNMGITLHDITSKYPNIKGINFDLPHVIQHAPSYPGVQHVAGDMFESVPEGDAIMVKHVLHDWSDEQCLRLLRNCCNAIPDNGKVIVVHAIIPVMPETTPSAKFTFQMDALMMIVNSGGKERTKQELVALATEARFNSVKFACFVCDYWIMEFYKS